MGPLSGFEALRRGIDFVIALAVLTILSISWLLTVSTSVVTETELLVRFPGRLLRLPSSAAFTGAVLLIAVGMLLAAPAARLRRGGWSAALSVLGAVLITNGAFLAAALMGLFPLEIVTEIVRQPPVGVLAATCVLSLAAAAGLRLGSREGTRFSSGLLQVLSALAAVSAAWGLIRWIHPQGHVALLAAAVILSGAVFYWRSPLLGLLAAERVCPDRRDRSLQLAIGLAREPLWQFAIIPAALYCGLKPGPDAPSYLVWAQAVRTATLQEIPSNVLSPTGLPVWQWLPGPGCWLAAPETLTAGLLEGGAAQWLSIMSAACIFWLSTALVLRELLGGARRDVRWGLGLVMIGTAAGYYSIAFSTEQLSLAAGGVLASTLFSRRMSFLTRLLAMGCATALLIAARPNLAVFAAPVLGRGMVELSRRTGWRRPLGLILLAAPSILAVAQVATVNAWMTGVWSRSPYSFGDDQFRSLDFTCPHWFEILLHPLHGALIYHPLIVLGLASQVQLMRKAPNRRERIAWLWWGGATVVTFLFHSGWYYWWMATNVTFGMRGLVMPSYFSVLALCRWHYIRSTSQSARAPNSAFVLDACTCGALVWSWWLLIQGPTDYFRWTDLLTGQGSALSAWFDKGGPVRLFVAGGLVTLLIPARSGPSRRATWMAVAATAEVLLADWLLNLMSTKAVTFLPRLGIALTLAFGVAGLGMWMGRRLADREFARLTLLPTTTLSVLLCGLLVSFLFLEKAAPLTRTELANHVDRFLWREPFYVHEPSACLQDYELIPGYTSEKQSLRSFLARHGIPERDAIGR